MPELKVGGMRCVNCQNAVGKALNGLDGLLKINVDLAKGVVSWEDKDPTHPVDMAVVKKEINKIGFEA